MCQSLCDELYMVCLILSLEHYGLGIIMMPILWEVLEMGYGSSLPNFGIEMGCWRKVVKKWERSR